MTIRDTGEICANRNSPSRRFVAEGKERACLRIKVIRYLRRNCTVLKGTPSPYMASKHGIDAFRMTIDEETGILLCLEGTKNGDTVEYMTVTAVDFEPTEDVRRFDENLFDGYRMKTR